VRSFVIVRGRIHREPSHGSPRRARARHLSFDKPFGRPDGAHRVPPREREGQAGPRRCPRSCRAHRGDAGHDVVFHLAANPEARWGLERTRLDLDQGTIATYNALEAARQVTTRRFVFASSGTVYGNTSEACGEQDLGRLPISLYGASKLAGEALLAAYARMSSASPDTSAGSATSSAPVARTARFSDFCKMLKRTRNHLQVLGDGTQSEALTSTSAIVVAGILHVLDHAKGENPAIYKPRAPDWTTVRSIAERVVGASPDKGARIECMGGVAPGFGPGTCPSPASSRTSSPPWASAFAIRLTRPWPWRWTRCEGGLLGPSPLRRRDFCLARLSPAPLPAPPRWPRAPRCGAHLVHVARQDGVQHLDPGVHLLAEDGAVLPAGSPGAVDRDGHDRATELGGEEECPVLEVLKVARHRARPLGKMRTDNPASQELPALLMARSVERWLPRSSGT